MPNRFSELFSAPVFNNDERKTRVAAFLNSLLILFLAGTLVSNAALPFVQHPMVLLASTGAVIAFCSGDFLVLRRGRVKLASVLFLSGHCLSYAILVIFLGGNAMVFSIGFVTSTVIAGLLFGEYAAAGVAGISILGGLTVYILENLGQIPEPLYALHENSGWIVITANLIITVAVLRLANRSIGSAVERARRHELSLLKANRELSMIRESLETQVAERTRDLTTRGAELEEINRRLERTLNTSERRAAMLQTSAQVSRATAQIRELDKLLPRVTELISQQFGVYHVGIFLVDDAGRYAVLRASNSPGGHRMLARKHMLSVGSEGIVGCVTASGEPRVALDVDSDASFFDNPDLPDTRSEMALPLRIGDDVIGALDVQSTEDAAFDDEGVTVLTTLADQIAIAIQNARLFQQNRAALEEAKSAYRRYLRQEWDSLLATRAIRLR